MAHAMILAEASIRPAWRWPHWTPRASIWRQSHWKPSPFRGI